MRKPWLVLLNAIGLLFGMVIAVSAGGGPPLPCRIGGTVTIDGVQITQATDDGLVITVTKPDGTKYVDSKGENPQDSDGLNASNVYWINLPIYSETDQPGGAKTGESAKIHVFRNQTELIVSTPANGIITVGASGGFERFDLSAVTSVPALSVNPTNQAVAKDVGTTTFTVGNTGTGTMSWTAAVTSGSSWLSITSGASGTNSGTITCAFTANTVSTGRSGVIRVTATGATGSPMDVTVTQAAGPKQYTISVSASPAEGGNVTGGGTYKEGTSATVTATANQNWQFVNWTEGGQQVSTSASYTFTVTGNRTLAANFSKVPVLTVSPANQNVAKDSGTTTFTVGNTGGGTMSWMAAVTSGGSWLSITSGASGTNSGTITCAFTANTVSTGRSGVIRVTATGATGSPMDVTVTQAAGPKQYTISVSASPAEGGNVTGGGTYKEGTSATVTATANQNWQFVNWTEGGQQVSTSASYTFTVTGNRTLAANFSKVPVLTVSPANQNVAKDSGTTTFTVGNTGGGTMSWMAAVTSGGSWLSITSGASGTNSGTITCAFTANTVTTGRTGVIRVTAAGATGSPKDVTVTQAAAVIPTPTPTITPTPTPTITPTPTPTITPTPTPTPSVGKIPDTGQTTCYDADGYVITCPSPSQAFYGQDANYSINPPSYTKLDSNGKALADSATSWAMVKDNVTGLIWENKTDDGSIHDKDNTYTWYDSNPATNGGFAGTPGDGTDTEDFIKALNNAKFGGLTNWRMPTVNELVYLINYGIIYPGPAIDTRYFPNIQQSYYWSSTPDASVSSDTWEISFSFGWNISLSKSDSSYAMAVSGGQSASAANSATAAGAFIDHGDGTVTDTSTGLMWQQETAGMMDWEHALSYCENLSLGGHTDWRLPTIKELHSLLDCGRYDPAINSTFFPDTQSYYYWASTTFINSTETSWFVNFYSGADYADDKYFDNYFRAVRNGQSGTSPILSVSPLVRNVANGAGTTTFSVSNAGTGTMPWTASVTSGSSWLSIQSGASGSNTGTITCAFTANTSSTARTGTIRVTATGATGSPKDVTVTQAGQPVQSAGLFWGVWSDGVWTWEKASGKWNIIAFTSNASMIAVGKVDADAADDLFGVWSSGLWLRYAASGQWVKLSSSLPTWIVSGDMNNDGRDDVVGIWSGGVYYRDSATGQWVMLTSAPRQLAVGKMDGTQNDLIEVWDSSGIWVWHIASEYWEKIDASVPTWVTAGDMNGDNLADIIGSYSSGTWYRNSANGGWVKITSSAMKLASGDLNGDGRDDLVGIWADGVWVRYAVTNQWQKIASSRPYWITASKTATTFSAAGRGDNMAETDGKFLDLSDDGPGGNKFNASGQEIASPE